MLHRAALQNTEEGQEVDDNLYSGTSLAEMTMETGDDDGNGADHS